MTGSTARIRGALPPLERLHQEDFCRAQGIIPDTKYQKEGGPSLRQCFALLREVSTAPVIYLARLLDALIYNFLVGNNDAHGKNLSLLCHRVGTANQQIRLAPLYDVVSTTYYLELSKDMAMKIGGEYSSDKVTPKNIEQLVEEASLAKPMVRNRVPELTETVVENLDKAGTDQPVANAVAALIRRRCEMVRKGFRN